MFWRKGARFSTKYVELQSLTQPIVKCRAKPSYRGILLYKGLGGLKIEMAICNFNCPALDATISARLDLFLKDTCCLLKGLYSMI